MGTPIYGSFGNSEDSAVRTEFFTWFHLEEVDRENRERGSWVVRFRPGNPDFRPMVVCELHCGADRLMTRMVVEISAVFIEDPRTGAFALDYARSFLGDGLVYQSDADKVADVLRDLRHRSVAGTESVPLSGSAADGDMDDILKALTEVIDRGETVLATRGVPGEARPELPAVVSRGFAVYLGERESFRRDLTLTRFAMENITRDEGRVLRLSFERLPGAGGVD
ncbi:hypothetical protein [Streptomyces mirabilis]|uniref:hypothetical protein n=1 Tax=Streptomyces mirabilis TaxID=68239 RepID=UPI0033BF8685